MPTNPKDTNIVIDPTLVKYAALSGKLLLLERERTQAEKPLDRAHITNRIRGVSRKLHQLEEMNPAMLH